MEKIIVNEIELFQINGFENYYISKNGDFYNQKFERFINPWLDKGYYRICLYKNKVLNLKSVHRLLGLTFIHNDDPDNKPEIDHINQIKTDNRLENLQWSDRTGQQFNRGLFKNNTSGIKGVRIDDMNNRITAQWSENGILKTKSFSINKFGYNEAFEMACEYRKTKMNEIYNIIE